MPTAQVAFENAPSRDNVHLLPIAFQNAPAAMKTDNLADFDLPWLGLLVFERVGVQFSGKAIEWSPADEAEALPAQLQIGRFRATFYQEPSLRPRRLTVAALALALANVAGWTEGHLWSLF